MPTRQPANAGINNFGVNLHNNNYFGSSLAMSTSGDKMAVGAYGDGGDDRFGAVYLFTLDWNDLNKNNSVVLISKLSNDSTNGGLDKALSVYDHFGVGVDMSDDGSKLAVGASGDDSGGVDESGAVYLFEVNWTTGAVSKKAKLSKSRTNGGLDTALEIRDRFGYSVGLSGNGSKLAVGASRDGDGGAVNSGAVYLFELDWNNLDANNGVSTKAKLSKARANGGLDGQLKIHDSFGSSLTMSSDATKLVVGSRSDDAGTLKSGSVYLFELDWGNLDASNGVVQKARLSKASANGGLDKELEEYDYFGSSLTISSDYTKLVVGALGDDDGDTNNSGAVYLFSVNWANGIVNKKAKLSKASANGVLGAELETGDNFGNSVALSGDGTKLTVGSIYNGVNNSGGVYLFNVDWDNLVVADRVSQKLKMSRINSDNKQSYSSGVNGERRGEAMLQVAFSLAGIVAVVHYLFKYKFYKSNYEKT